MTTQAGRTVLLIGATGGIGAEAARAFLAHGWTVRALHRDPARAAKSAPADLQWVQGDAMAEADVVAPAKGVDLIFHGANPPGYHNWEGTVVPMLANTVAAARASGARILFPASVYNFDPAMNAHPDEAAPQRPVSRKGAIRVRMEASLRAAADEGVRSLVVRAGDFFGPLVTANWIPQIVKPDRPVRSAAYPGPRDRAHAWAYLPDLAETMVRLAEREAELGAFEVFHFGGHALTGEALVEALERIVGRRMAVKAFPWLGLSLIAPFVEMLREVKEMRYLWDQPLTLDNTKLVRFLGAEPHTPIDVALRRTLEGLGCLEAPAKRAA